MENLKLYAAFALHPIRSLKNDVPILPLRYSIIYASICSVFWPLIFTAFLDKEIENNFVIWHLVGMVVGTPLCIYFGLKFAAYIYRNMLRWFECDQESFSRIDDFLSVALSGVLFSLIPFVGSIVTSVVSLVLFFVAAKKFFKVGILQTIGLLITPPIIVQLVLVTIYVLMVYVAYA